jgi:citrate/tricarballylate utilization protein
MELRREFPKGDLTYLANLCHDCRACYYACPYAPPHEFALNLPQAFALLRAESYAESAWPRSLAALLRRNQVFVALATSASTALVLFLTALLQPPAVLYLAQDTPGAFYRVIPKAAMVGVGGLTFAFALLAFGLGLRNFWHETGGGPILRAGPWLQAFRQVLALRNLSGGGSGCNDLDGRFSQSRRYFHQALFYGFGLCFASTCTAAVYDNILGSVAPYPLFSLPVLLGTAGGVGMVAGTAGLAWIKRARDPAPAAKSLRGADDALLLLLFLTAATGLVLLALRSTALMGLLLALHLGFTLSLFLTLPYSKFVHGIYRSAALLRYAAERSKPSS